MTAKATRKLTVTACSEVKTGETNGKPWTLYEVSAVDEGGHPVEEALKSFTNLPLGEQAEYVVERQEHDKYGPSYLLSPRKRESRAVRELRERVDALEAEVAALKAFVRRRSELNGAGGERCER
jgi:hypothetical protein